MEAKLTNYDLKRQELYKQYKKYMLIGVLTFIILVGFIFLIMAANVKKKYDTFVKTTLIDELIKEMYPDAVYNHNQMIDIKYIMSLGIVRRPDRWFGEDYFGATYKGVQFQCCDLTLQEERTTTDSKGNTRTYYVTYFRGRFYSFQVPRTFEHKLQVMEKGAGHKAPGKLKKYETESIEFNKKFNTYSTDQHYVFYQLTPVIQLTLLEFEKMHSGTVQVLYHTNKLDVLVNDSKNTLNLSIKTPLTKESLANIIEDIQMPAAIINEFNLDSDKFKNR